MNGDVDSYNVDEICRLCLKGEGTILPIFGLEHSSRDCIPLSNKIKACVAVEIDRNDELPKKICVGCVHQVDSWHKFKTACDTAQTKLSSWIKTTERYKSTTSEIIIKQEPIDEVEDDDVIICCDDDSNDNDAVYSLPQSPTFEDISSAPEPVSAEFMVEDHHHHKDGTHLDDNSRSNKSAENDEHHHQNSGNVSNSIHENNVEMGSPSKERSMLENALEGGVETNEKSYLNEDEIMMADFSDEIAPDVNLLKDVEVDVHQDNIDSDNEIDGLVDENSATSTGVVNTEGSTLISKIHIEMNRRISADYDIEPDDFDDFDYEDGPVEESNLDVPMEQSQSNEVGVVERVRVTRSSKRVGDESADVTKSESGMLIEAFTLAGKRSFDADPFNEEHEKLLNGAVGSSSNVDPDTLTVHSSISQSDATSMIVKQEPLSPGVDNEYGPSITKDWSTESTAAVDVKPNVEELNKKRQKRKYRKRIKLGSIPCEPCGYTYPNYVKFIRHCKSQKHRNNVRIYEKLGKTVPKQPSPEPVTPPKLNSTHSPTSVDVSNGTGSNMCPIMSCSKSFKYRRNLQSHVKHNHGFNLKDFERSEPIDETYIPPEPPAETEPQESPPIDGRKSTTFSCNMCSKEFGYRRSLKHHLFIFHNVTPPTPRLKCPKCMKNFQRMTGLKSHLRSCGVFLNSKRCPYCQEDFPTYKDNYRHKSVCPKKYASKEKSLQAVKKIFSAPENSRYRCRFCDIMFEARSIYSDHMEMYHPGESIDVVEEPPVPELITQKDLTSSEDVKDNNVMIKVNNGEVPCKFCFKTFPSISELNIHVEEHQYSKSFECKLCKSVLTTMRNFHDHMRSHFVTHRKQYLCWTCYTPFNNRSELGAHKKLHENITMRIYTCNVCKHSFHDEASFQHHKQTHFYGFESEASEHVNSKRTLLKTIKNDERETDEAKVASLLCQICKKEFSNQTALDKHSRLHKPVNSEVIKKLVQHCSTCNKTFKSRFELRNHQPYCKQTNQDGEAQMNVSMPSYKKSIYNKTAHPHQRVHCDKCGGSFAKAIGLKKHITMNRCPLVRQDVDKVKKTYSCRYCRKVLATIAGLYKHLNGCKKFISKYGKNYHSNQCPTCHKQFSSLGVLYNHARFCSGSSTAISKLIKQEPGVYKSCDNCQAKFDTDELFDEHKKACKTSVNRDSNQFEKNCAYCNLRFDNVTNYKLHKKYCSKGESSSSSPTGSFRCEGCSRVCFSQDRLKSHLKTCKFYRQTPVVMLTKQTVIEQCKCGVVFTSRSALDAHRVNCAVVKDTTNDSKENSNSTPVNPKNLECQYCHRKFEKYYSRNSHLRICKAKHRHLYGKRGPSANQQQKQSKPTPSTTSPSLTSTPKPQTNHLPPPPPMIPLSSLSSSMTSSSTSFMCSMCNSLFPTESDLMLHNCHQQHPPPTHSNDAVEIMVEPDNPLNFNDYSDFGFHYMDDISQREQNSLREQNLLKCLPCDKVFSSSVTLNKHRNLFHPNEATDMYLVKGDGTVQCPKCPRSFKDQKSMAHHMGWHTRLEDSSGQQQQQQQQQVSNSTNMFMPTPPPVASSSSSSSSPSVPPYVEQKTPFPCTYCHRRFSGKGQLQNHLKTHTQQLPYPSSSSSNNSMDGDSQNPATTLTYRCRFCSKRFRDKSVMLEHQNLHKTILAASSTTTTTATPKPKPAVEPVPKYLVSCNMCHKILSSNSVAKHKKMHEMKENIRLHIPSLFTAINKPVQTKPNEVQYQQTKHDEMQYQQQQQQYLQQQQQYQQQIQPPQSMMVPCPICYRLFSGQRSLTDHMSTEHAGYSKIDVVEIDDDEDDYQSNNVNQSHLMDAGNVAYKCEICNLSWQHKSEYLQHVNDPSHRELTNRLSAILNRVNNDISIS